MTQTITYNRNDWTGIEETVVIKQRTFKVKGTNFNGTWKVIKDIIEGDEYSHAKVVVKDGNDVITEQTIYCLADNVWYGEMYDSSRESNNPVVTAMQIVHNTYF